VSREGARRGLVGVSGQQRRPILDRLALRYPRLLRASIAAGMELPWTRLRNALISSFVRRGYAAFNRGDFEVASASFAPDVEYEVPEELTRRRRGARASGRHRLLAGAASRVSGFARRPPDLLATTPDAFVVRLVVRGEGLFSRIGDELRGTEVFQVREGRVVSARNYMEESKALEAVGYAPGHPDLRPSG
jgi:ketosteroid isomerase-like protein